jgi:hypothetical protein
MVNKRFDEQTGRFIIRKQSELKMYYYWSIIWKKDTKAGLSGNHIIYSSVDDGCGLRRTLCYTVHTREWRIEMVRNKIPAAKATPKKETASKETAPTKVKRKKAGTKGCGRWIGECGGHHAGTVSISGICACGRSFSRSCSKSNCSGVTWYC